MARRRGRSRKPGPRHPNGELVEGRWKPDELLRHRAESVGGKQAKREEAGSAAGRLFLAGKIGQVEYDATIKLIEAWDRWRRLAAIPDRHPPAASYGEVIKAGPRPDCSAAAWEWAKSRYIGAVNAVGPGLRWAAVESVVIDDAAPPRLFEASALGDKIRAALFDGLARLAQYFNATVQPPIADGRRIA